MQEARPCGGATLALTPAVNPTRSRRFSNTSPSPVTTPTCPPVHPPGTETRETSAPLRVSLAISRARSGQSPRAISAMASNGSQTSAARSLSFSGLSGLAWSKIGTAGATQLSKCPTSGRASVVASPDLNRSKYSFAAFRRDSIRILLSARVSGSMPTLARALRAKTGKSHRS